jgi:hypothetical protein
MLCNYGPPSRLHAEPPLPMQAQLSSMGVLPHPRATYKESPTSFLPSLRVATVCCKGFMNKI